MQPKCTDDRELQRILQSMDEKNPAPQGAPIDLSRWKKWLWLILALGVLALGWRWFGGGEEQKLRRTFSDLGSAVSKSGGAASNLSALGTLDSLNRLFADPVTLQVSGDEDYGLAGTYSLAEIKGNIARVRQGCKSLKISFSDIRISSRNSTSATADATVRAVVNFDGGKFEEVRLLCCQLVKKDGHWCFKSFTERQILDKGKSGDL